jgi:hypothetical protein
MPADQLRERGLVALRDKLAEQVAIAGRRSGVGERAENVLEESRAHGDLEWSSIELVPAEG